MKKSLIKKSAIVKEIKEKIENSKSILVLQYSKLKVLDIQKLRTLFKENDSEFKVYKNNLISFALKDSNFSDLIKYLVGQNGLVFSYKDQLIPAKISAKFAKDHPNLKFKAGIYNNAVLDAKEMFKVALLPTKEELISTFAMLLKQPIVKFGMIIKEIIKSKENKEK